MQVFQARAALFLTLVPSAPADAVENTPLPLKIGADSPLSPSIAQAIAATHNDVVLEAGCGDGFYLGRGHEREENGAAGTNAHRNATGSAGASGAGPA
jgi:hypothetical protein